MESCGSPDGGGGGSSLGRSKFGRRLSAALSRVDFERCDPTTCISIIRVATIQVTRHDTDDSPLLYIPYINLVNF